MSNTHQNPADVYYAPKPEGDIDLVLEVRNILAASGLLMKLPETYDNHRFILEAAGKPSSVQRFLLNRYWAAQLAMAPRPSVEERYCLIPNGAVADWLDLFRKKIVPFVLDNDLPKSFLN